MITVELQAAVDAMGAVQTFYLSNEAFVTKPTDSPANYAFQPTLKDPGTITSSIFGDGQVMGSTSLEVGEIVVSNVNGQYDDWLNYGFDGRSVVIREGKYGDTYPGNFRVVFSGVVANIYADRKELRVRIKDKKHIFENKVLTEAYAGNNVLPNGVEGNATDIKGQVKPLVFGKVFNVSPLCVNTSKLTYQISKSALNSIDAVYDAGVALTDAGNFANLTALEAASPAAGTFITCEALGLFRLGATPAGEVTADATAEASAASMTTAQTLRKLARLAGVPELDIDDDALDALDAISDAVVGIYLSEPETTFIEAMDAVAKSAGAYYGFDETLKFVASQWGAPSGLPVGTIADYYAYQETERRPLKDVDVPIWQVRLSHSRNWTVQNSGVAGSVSQARRSKIGSEKLIAVAQDANVKSQFLLASVIELDTLLVDEAEAQAEADRLLALHKVRRDAFEVPVSIVVVNDQGIKLGSCVMLQISRFGLNAGKLMRVQSIRRDLARARATLTLWG